ncbi:hypothetical protein NJC38_07370 [Pseudomonas sp. 21LCFQ010]|uniref:hypothetical protein n=1 Tax=Pseudomonas sp. 21LCFQ010 TaxID=2957506 RepID=UPI002097B02C|nr:hypothetical protein [Pseudomonas sp. 21LCFQ010]MCO8161976.1 hypothetical protein [Pseudomonas sp. 21LCFQ010]
MGFFIECTGHFQYKKPNLKPNATQSSEQEEPIWVRVDASQLKEGNHKQISERSFDEDDLEYEVPFTAQTEAGIFEWVVIYTQTFSHASIDNVDDTPPIDDYKNFIKFRIVEVDEGDELL